MPMRRCSGGTTPCGEDSRRPATSYRAAIRGQETRQRAQHRGLAAARGAQQCYELAFLDCEADADQRAKRAEPLVDAGDVDESHRPSLEPAAARAEVQLEPDSQIDETCQRQDDSDREDGEGRDDLELAQIVEPVDGDGDGLGAAGVEQDRGAELAEGRDEHQEERHEQPRAATAGTGCVGSRATRSPL